MEKMVITISTNIVHIEMVVRVINDYVDGFHHVKEEILLFPLMVKKAFSNEQGPISVMLHDHAESRNCVKRMIVEIADFKKGNVYALNQLYNNMQIYIDLLRVHISIEKNVLFRMANRALSAQQQQDLLKEFVFTEMGYSEGEIQRLINDIKGLEAIYLGENVNKS